MTDERRSNVHLEHAQGVVVGDYATVFQYFQEAQPSLAQAIRVAEFAPLVDERTRMFVGRDFVFADIDAMLSGDEGPSGYVVIRGEPGIGKTAIAAQCVKRYGCAHHFNIAPQNIRTAREFLLNTCAQLIVRYELPYAGLPPTAGSDSGFLSRLLAEAAGKDRPVVVVVDALDEADDLGLDPSANRLFLPRTLPDGVYFIVTSREEHDFRLDVDRGRDIWIREEDPANREDAFRFIEAFIDDHANTMAGRLGAWGIGRSAFAQELLERSEGNFMYLVHVLRDIERGRLTREIVGEIGQLPRGLRSYYERHWRDMRAADETRFTGLQRPVLCFLAASREPVELTQLAEWTGLDLGDVKSVADEWHEFLNTGAGPGPRRFRIYHRSFAEFLDEAESLRWYHGRIGTSALAKIPDFLDG